MSDAEPARPPVSWKERRVPPKHAEVWVRISGTWRRGLIGEWIRTGAGWEVLILADEPGGSPPWQGRYVYDSRAIVPRYGDEPPSEES